MSYGPAHAMPTMADGRPADASRVVAAEHSLREIVRRLAPIGSTLPSIASATSALTTMARRELVVRMEFHQRTNQNNVLSNLKDFPCQLTLREHRANGMAGLTGQCVRFRVDVVVHSALGTHQPVDQLYVPQSHPPFLLLCGETEVDVVEQSLLILRIGRGITSFIYRDHKCYGESQALFSLRVAPIDTRIALANPGLTVITHPFKVVTKLKGTPAPVPNALPQIRLVDIDHPCSAAVPRARVVPAAVLSPSPGSTSSPPEARPMPGPFGSIPLARGPSAAPCSAVTAAYPACPFPQPSTMIAVASPPLPTTPTSADHTVRGFPVPFAAPITALPARFTCEATGTASPASAQHAAQSPAAARRQSESQ